MRRFRVRVCYCAGQCPGCWSSPKSKGSAQLCPSSGLVAAGIAVLLIYSALGLQIRPVQSPPCHPQNVTPRGPSVEPGTLLVLHKNRRARRCGEGRAWRGRARGREEGGGRPRAGRGAGSAGGKRTPEGRAPGWEREREEGGGRPRAGRRGAGSAGGGREDARGPSAGLGGGRPRAGRGAGSAGGGGRRTPEGGARSTALLPRSGARTTRAPNAAAPARPLRPLHPARRLTCGVSRRGASAPGPRCWAACWAPSRSRRAASGSTLGRGCARVTCSRTRRSCSGSSGAKRTVPWLRPGRGEPLPPTFPGSGSAPAMAA